MITALVGVRGRGDISDSQREGGGEYVGPTDVCVTYCLGGRKGASSFIQLSATGRLLYSVKRSDVTL